MIGEKAERRPFFGFIEEFKRNHGIGLTFAL
jgi:hypothetical protein